MLASPVSPSLTRLPLSAERTLEACASALRDADIAHPELRGMAQGVAQTIQNVHNLRPDGPGAPTGADRASAVRVWAEVVTRRGNMVCPQRPGWNASDDGASTLPASADPSEARMHVTLIQYCAEKWLADQAGRLAMPRDGAAEAQGPMRVTAIIHTPKPCTPLLMNPGEPVPDSLIAPASRQDPLVIESVARRVESVRNLARSGAEVYVCYPESARSALGEEQKLALNRACDEFGIVDRPTTASADAYRAVTGATYFLGSQAAGEASLGLRLVQAAKIGLAADEPDPILVGIAVEGDELFVQQREELDRQIGFSAA
jgi:hypothetical protein